MKITVNSLLEADFLIEVHSKGPNILSLKVRIIELKWGKLPFFSSFPGRQRNIGKKN